jgi:hypothetical protein
VEDGFPDQGDREAERVLRAQMEAAIAQLDLVAEFEAAGSPYSELDENGRIVTHYPPTKSP